tara:strand:+ start:1691 stop:2809 length:1119 start_codon:yes stop_codon:yes gene_type:complete
LDKTAADLLFLSKKYPDWNMAAIAQQVAGKQKTKKKIPTWFNTKNILYPVRLSLEQCSSEETAKYKAEIIQGKRFIDLTGGFGVDTYFISRSFKESVHCEINEELQYIAQHNFKILGSGIQSFHQNGLEYLKTVKEKFDLIYIDPARRNYNNQKVIKLSDYTPNILEHIDLLFEKGKNILVKTAPLLDIKQALNELPYVKEIHIVSLKNECKEVLYLLDQKHTAEAYLHCINTTQSKYSFSYSQENETAPLSDPLDYLYEPNASILKAGAFNSIANDFKLQKLHPNSHLYTSHNLLEGFPGRTFKIDTICKYNKKEILKHFSVKKANIARRNFPDSVVDIRKKTGIKEGGEHYLFATTLQDNQPKILLCTKV